MSTSMCMVKKHAIGPPPSAVATISTNAFFLLDTHTGLRFLIDTGACRSLLPKCKVHSGCIAGTDTNLIAANGSWILTYGYKTLQLSFAGSKYKWDFIVADVSTPIIGVDFLANFNLLVHDLAHPSARSTTTLLKKKFIGHSISKDSKAWVHSCIPCQQAKIHQHTESGIGSFPQPKRRFAHVHVNIIGPPPPSEDHRYLFTIIDRSTRWPEAVPLVDSSAASCATAFLSAWVSRSGVPEHITSNKGSSFTSLLWTSLNKLLG